MTLSLNCFILGDDPDRTFTVEIPSTKNVSILKDLIKEKKAPHFNHIAASDLDLWRVSFPIDNLEMELKNFNFAGRTKLSPPSKKLTTFFSDVTDDDLHVIVKVSASRPAAAPDPSQLLSLNCLVLGDELKKWFTVEIEETKNVSILKDMIKEKKAPHLDHFAASDLDLFQVSIPIDDDADQRLNESNREPLKSPLPLLQLFHRVEKNHLQVLVQVSKPDSTSLASLPNLSNLREERQRFDAAFPGKAPSSQGAPSTFSKLQQKPNQKIVWSRPPPADATIPVTLLHPILRQFVDDCENHQPIQPDNELVLKLMAAMSNFFPDENARAEELRNILTDHGIPVVTSTISSKGHHFPTDGAVAFNGHLVAIVEVKAEIGSQGAEPYAQVILYYTHSTLAKAKAKSFLKFNFPALLITVFGPQISFSGAVWTTRPHFQVLTPTLPLFCHHTDTNMRESLARHFGALKKAIRSLEQCYEALQNPAFLENLDSQFPDPRTYHFLETKTTVNFKYLRQIDEKKLLFVGETDNTERICIKFARRYSPAVHKKCAEMGIAPKLRGFEEIGAGWKMVIMDALDEEYQPFDKRTLPVGAEKYLRERLVELHQANFVHGDVRDVNVMVRKDGKLGFMLVDFDWSGIIGEAHYPINVNKVDLWRPDDVSDGLLIKSDHDMAMLDRIFL